ncbi:hypothetical protein HYPSUDRAFT_91198 [Hypholoma sublateritium FD-334 SS-4]|uniref:Dienelactone hydrolase domain-containing protein n=1 Tax=Hypholoma sublateritium (strain FD-334 SS-4) TaxID=945553 RepID=A0A0D2NBR2_HYPSF|nr:hypothetical protein HYPSUDRAFT_91198 [Hypholoma sublateritium FD-334 SS-4]
MSFCEHCVKGVTWHEGTPQGKWEKIGGVDTYVATPTVEYAKDKAILFLPDALGPQHINNRLLADDFAANGFKTYVPDYLNGDPIPPDALNPGQLFDIMKRWFPTHTQEFTRPPLDAVIAALKAAGVTSLGATGYCFGAGRYVFDLAFENIIKVGVVSHPSLFKTPDDLAKYVAQSTAPLLINSCTNDAQFPLEASAQADALFAGFAPGYKRAHFEGLAHGFAVRGDLSKPAEKAGKEGAFRFAIEWFVARL